jgi:nitroreductase
MEGHMADLLPALTGRFACRSFTDRVVTDRALQTILEAGRIAPSGFGMEPWRFMVVGTSEAGSKVASACFNQPPAVTAPVLVAVIALVDALWPDTAYVQARLHAEAGGGPVPDELKAAYRGFHEHADVRNWAIGQCNFAAAQMMVQAASMGLATCPIGGFDEAALAAALNLPSGEVPALVLAVGHCADRQGERHRKTMEEIYRDI